MIINNSNNNNITIIKTIIILIIIIIFFLPSYVDMVTEQPTSLRGSCLACLSNAVSSSPTNTTGSPTSSGGPGRARERGTTGEEVEEGYGPLKTVFLFFY